MARNDMAEDCDIPEPYAHKILKKPAEGGLMSSQVGWPEGFRLRKDLRFISLGMVIEILRGLWPYRNALLIHSFVRGRRAVRLLRSGAVSRIALTRFLREQHCRIFRLRWSAEIAHDIKEGRGGRRGVFVGAWDAGAHPER
jgi:hypothetical protein